MHRKGQSDLIPIVVGIIFLSILVPVIYLAITPVYTTSQVVNETFTMAAVPVMVQLTNKDVVSGSVTVYNGSTGSVAIPATEATADDCGGGQQTCYYNVTLGNAYTHGTIGVNKTGSYKVVYSYYPSGYSHQSQDRAIILLVSTFLILGVLVIIAKSVGLI